MPSAIHGVDEIRDSKGNLLAQLGFGVSSDWEIIDRQVITSAVASVDLDVNDAGFDPTLYDEYEISIGGLLHSADTGLGIRTSTDGGATYDAGAADYMHIMSRVSMTASEFVGRIGDPDTTRILMGDALGTAANEITSWKVWVGPLDDGQHKSFSWVGGGRISDANGYGYWGSGMREGTTDINGIQIRMDSGNIEAGTFVLRGRRKVPSTLNIQDDWVVIDKSDISAASTHDVLWPEAIYDEIEVTYHLEVGTTGTEINIRLSDDGTTFEADASDYEYELWGNQNQAAAEFETEGNGNTEIRLAQNVETGAGKVASGTAKLYGTDSATTPTTLTFLGTQHGAASVLATVQVAGAMVADAACLGVQLLGAGGTLTGRVTVRGRRATPAGGSIRRWTEAILQTTDATVTSIADIPLASGEAKVVRFFGVATEAATANSLGFSGSISAKNNAGTSAEAAGPVIDKYDASPASAWDIDADVDDTSDTIRIRVTGEAATTIDWRVQYEVITEDNV